MVVSSCVMRHVLGSQVLLGFLICSMLVHFGWFQDFFQALGFCVLTRSRYQPFLSTPFRTLPFFLLILSVWQLPVFFPCHVGAHGWVTWICQPWGVVSIHGLVANSGSSPEVSPAPSLHFATQLLISLTWNHCNPSPEIQMSPSHEVESCFFLIWFLTCCS